MINTLIKAYFPSWKCLLSHFWLPTQNIGFALSPFSRRPPAGDAAEIWWPLCGPGEGCGSSCIVWDPLEGLAGAPPALPRALRSVPARHWARSVVQWHRERTAPHTAPPRQTRQASPLSPRPHCFPTVLLKHEGVAHRCYFKLCVSSLLESQFTLTLGEGTFPLNQMLGIEEEEKGFASYCQFLTLLWNLSCISDEGRDIFQKSPSGLVTHV